ncbi:MAG TPA: hypothetical protein VGK15_01070 [Candidatus Limnocylindria bacterium]|jgi:hypothetical protein
MEILAFGSFAALVVVWLFAPTKAVAVEPPVTVEHAHTEPAAA